MGEASYNIMGVKEVTEFAWSIAGEELGKVLQKSFNIWA